jgi:hypothetical protein
MILNYPGATIFSWTKRITEVSIRGPPRKLTRDFLECPERYFRHLFAEPDEED